LLPADHRNITGAKAIARESSDGQTSVMAR
jgi:hypothetical protein